MLPVPSTDFEHMFELALVLGVQGCLWSENLYKTSDVEYMLYPRLFALAEVAWTSEMGKNWVDFTKKLPLYLSMLEKSGINFATTAFNPTPEIRFDSTAHGLACVFEQQIERGETHFTLDGTEPGLQSTVYKTPIFLKKPAEIRAAAFENGKVLGKTMAISYRPSLASGKNFQLKNLPDKKYNGARPECLTDGQRGSQAFHDGKWCGFYGDDFDLTIDLGEVQPLQNIAMDWLESNGSWIFLPTFVTVEISEDGQNFDRMEAIKSPEIQGLSPNSIKKMDISLGGKKARFVRIFAKNQGAHPVFKDGKCWLFIDEVAINKA